MHFSSEMVLSVSNRGKSIFSLPVSFSHVQESITHVQSNMYVQMLEVEAICSVSVVMPGPVETVIVSWFKP